MPPVAARALQSPPFARRLVWALSLAVGAVVLRSLMAVLLVERDRSSFFALASTVAVLPPERAFPADPGGRAEGDGAVRSRMFGFASPAHAPPAKSGSIVVEVDRVTDAMA